MCYPKRVGGVKILITPIRVSAREVTLGCGVTSMKVEGNVYGRQLFLYLGLKKNKKTGNKRYTNQ